MSKKSICLKQWEIPGLLDGSKTLIVRPITPQPPEGYICAGRLLDTTGHHDRKNIGKVAFTDLDYKGAHYYRLPFEAGDVLLGRETWRYGDCADKTLAAAQNVGCVLEKCDIWQEKYMYYADDIPCKVYCKWRSPVTMPSEAVRIKLAVRDVRVLRVQDITPEQIEALGIKECTGISSCGGGCVSCYGSRSMLVPRYKSQWDTDNPKLKWAENPWIMAVEIERVV